MHDNKQPIGPQSFKDKNQPDPLLLEHSEEEIDLRELLQKLNRRRKAIIGIFLLVVIVAGLYLHQTTPMYTAETLLTLDIRKSRVVDIEDVLSGISTDVSVIGTELDIIRSGSILSNVADKLKLHLDPAFNPSLLENEQKGLADRFKGWLRGLWFQQPENIEEPYPDEEEQRLKKQIVNKIGSRLKVEHRRQSYTIAVSFTSPDPGRAAQVANTVAELYLLDQLEAKYDATRRANEWLADRLENLRREVQASEEASKDLRQRSDIIQAGGRTLLEQQIGDVNTQLIQARLNRSRAVARLERAGAIMGHAGGIESLGEVLESRVIQQLRSDETSLRRKKAELSQRYGPKHPQMIQIQAEMEDLQNKLQEEANRILASLENEVQSARAEERSLELSLDKLRGEAGSAMEAELKLMELERQAQSSRQLYQSFLDRFQETREQDSLQRPDARIISQAEVPETPSYPRKKMTMILAAAAGMMLGVGGAFLLEILDRGFRTGNQVEKATGVPVLGMIPAMARRNGFPDRYVLEKPHSAMSEALRGVRTAIHLSNVDQPPKSVLITSSAPLEGKTTLCMTMGYLAALSGAKVLIIDADLRRAAMKKRAALDMLSEFKLEDVLQGEAELKDAISIDKKSGLHLLLSHGKTPSAGELLGSKRMAEMIRSLSGEYDLVLIDTPPVMVVSDAWNLANSVDVTIFVVRWSETPREMVHSALRQMKNLNIRVSGIVMTRVDLRRQSGYGYEGYGYYYGKYNKYYQE